MQNLPTNLQGYNKVWFPGKMNERWQIASAFSSEKQEEEEREWEEKRKRHLAERDFFHVILRAVVDVLAADNIYFDDAFWPVLIEFFHSFVVFFC